MKITIVIGIFMAYFQIVKPQISPSLTPLVSPSSSLAPSISSPSPLAPLIPSPSSLSPLNPSPSSLAPEVSTSCSAIIYDMVDCLSFYSHSSKEEIPTPSCCSGFQAVLKVNAECICEALKSSAELGVDLNLAKAATLPFACQVSAAPIIKCDVSASPGTAPALAPANPPFIGAPTPTRSLEALDVPGSSDSSSPSPLPSPAPAPSAVSDEVGKQAPAPLSSGTDSLTARFFVVISMLVILVSHISE